MGPEFRSGGSHMSFALDTLSAWLCAGTQAVSDTGAGRMFIRRYFPAWRQAHSGPDRRGGVSNFLFLLRGKAARATGSLGPDFGVWGRGLSGVELQS